MEAGGNYKTCKNCGHSIIELKGVWAHRSVKIEQVRVNPLSISNPEKVTDSCLVDQCKCHNPEPSLVDE